MGRRRLVIAVVAGVLALGVLAGCRSDPGAAAFVGDTRISTSQVDDVVDGFKADGGQVDQAGTGSFRRTIANVMVFNEVAKRYAAQKNLTVPQPDDAAAAAALQLPASNPWVRLVAQYNANLQMLVANVAPANPTDADYLSAADLLISQGFVPPSGLPNDRTNIGVFLRSTGASQVATGIGIRDALTQVVKDENVTVNPVFGPASLPLSVTEDATGRRVPTVVLPLTAGATTSPAVVDIANPE